MKAEEKREALRRKTNLIASHSEANKKGRRLEKLEGAKR